MLRGRRGIARRDRVAEKAGSGDSIKGFAQAQGRRGESTAAPGAMGISFNHLTGETRAQGTGAESQA